MAIGPATYLRRNGQGIVDHIEHYIDRRLYPNSRILNKETNNIEIEFPNQVRLSNADELDLINRYRNAGWKFVSLSFKTEDNYGYYTIHLR